MAPAAAPGCSWRRRTASAAAPGDASQAPLASGAAGAGDLTITWERRSPVTSTPGLCLEAPIPPCQSPRRFAAAAAARSGEGAASPQLPATPRPPSGGTRDAARSHRNAAHYRSWHWRSVGLPSAAPLESLRSVVFPGDAARACAVASRPGSAGSTAADCEEPLRAVAAAALGLLAAVAQEQRQAESEAAVHLAGGAGRAGRAARARAHRKRASVLARSSGARQEQREQLREAREDLRSANVEEDALWQNVLERRAQRTYVDKVTMIQRFMRGWLGRRRFEDLKDQLAAEEIREQQRLWQELRKPRPVRHVWSLEAELHGTQEGEAAQTRDQSRERSSRDRSRERSSDAGANGLVLTLTLPDLDGTRLWGDRARLDALQASVRGAVVAEAGAGLRQEHVAVELDAEPEGRGGRVQAIVESPRNPAGEQALATLQAAADSGRLAGAVAEALQGAVGNVSVEVSRPGTPASRAATPLSQQLTKVLALLGDDDEGSEPDDAALDWDELAGGASTAEGTSLGAGTQPAAAAPRGASEDVLSLGEASDAAPLSAGLEVEGGASNASAEHVKLKEGARPPSPRRFMEETLPSIKMGFAEQAAASLRSLFEQLETQSCKRGVAGRPSPLRGDVRVALGAKQPKPADTEAAHLVKEQYLASCATWSVKPNSQALKCLGIPRLSAGEDGVLDASYDFAMAHLGDRGAICMLHALAHDHHCASISLRACGLQRSSAPCVAAFAEMHPRLCHLDLSSNGFSFDAGELLLQALQQRQGDEAQRQAAERKEQPARPVTLNLGGTALAWDRGGCTVGPPVGSVWAGTGARFGRFAPSGYERLRSQLDETQAVLFENPVRSRSPSPSAASTRGFVGTASPAAATGHMHSSMYAHAAKGKRSFSKLGQNKSVSKSLQGSRLGSPLT